MIECNKDCHKRVIQGLPSEMAEFILSQPKLSKRRVGEYIGNIDALSQRVCEELFARYDFTGKTLDAALRLGFKIKDDCYKLRENKKAIWKSGQLIN